MTAPAVAEVKIAMGTPADIKTNGAYVWLRAFADELEASGMEVVFYPNSALGTETERADQLSIGLLEVNDTGFNEVGKSSDLMLALALPFLFDSYEHLERALHEAGFLEMLNRQTRPLGMRIVDVSFGGAMYGIFNTKRPIRRIQDMADLRMRAMDGTQIKFMDTWDVNGTQVAFEEVGHALQTGIVDGYLNPPYIAIMFGHTRVLKHYADLRVGLSFRPMVISEDWYQGLGQAGKSAIRRAVIEARAANRTWNRRSMAAGTDLLRDLGVEVTVITPGARSQWIERSRRVYAEIVPQKTVDLVMGVVERAR